MQTNKEAARSKGVKQSGEDIMPCTLSAIWGRGRRIPTRGFKAYAKA